MARPVAGIRLYRKGRVSLHRHWIEEPDPVAAEIDNPEPAVRQVEGLVRISLLLTLRVRPHRVIGEHESPEIGSVDADGAGRRRTVGRKRDALPVRRQRNMARLLARKIHKALHRPYSPAVHAKADDRTHLAASIHLLNRGVEELAVTVKLEICRALDALHRLDDLRRTGFRIAFKDMKRLLVSRSGVAADIAVDY